MHGIPDGISQEKLATWGKDTRKGFLNRVEKAFQKPAKDSLCGGIPMATVLLDVDNTSALERAEPPEAWPEAKQYLREMRSWVSGRAVWGGVAELHALAHMGKWKIFLVERLPDETWQLFFEPLGPDTAQDKRICLAWNGGQFQ